MVMKPHSRAPLSGLIAIGHRSTTPASRCAARRDSSTPFERFFQYSGRRCRYREPPQAICLYGLRAAPIRTHTSILTLRECKPGFRFMQPEQGSSSVLAYVRMGRPKKISTPKDIINQVLADNILSRLDGAFPRARNQTEQLKMLAKRSGVGMETLRMAIKAERSLRIDLVDKIARAFGTSAAQLLTTTPAPAVTSAEARPQA